VTGVLAWEAGRRGWDAVEVALKTSRLVAGKRNERSRSNRESGLHVQRMVKVEAMSICDPAQDHMIKHQTNQISSHLTPLESDDRMVKYVGRR
jgi:adenosylmethionine-8-amino-7-oxononanoate aminotransferase